ncbi:mechanosensitive ion channel domain-containing protein [Thalassococcus sp. BH17M4-6]|uniref:mechanosensitive ion channel domain-containing protein n=1 Tax=Thalassococcus sp. BH17M4-6 TaxID=3413148 RepID=UPI003BF47867
MTASIRGGLSVFLLVLVSLLSLGSPSFAQSTPAPSGGDSSASTDSNVDPLVPFLDVLKNDKARAELITELEKATKAAPDAAAQATGTADEPRMSLGGRIATLTQNVAESAAAEAQRVWQSLANTGSVFDGLGGNELSVLFEAFRGLLLVIALTVVVFVALRMLAMPFFRSMGKSAQNASLVRAVMLYAGSLIVDALIVLAAWAIGYVVTVMLLGEVGQIGFRQSLYLNAFLLVEMVKVAMRAVISPSASGLRLLPISDQAARRLNRVLTVAVTILGYGQLLVLPIVNQSASYAAGTGVSAALSVLTLLYLFFAVVRYRRPVSDWLHNAIAPPRQDGEGAVPEADDLHGITRMLVNKWHWLALAYLTFMFVTVMSRPTDVVMDYVTASLKVAAAVILASALYTALSRAMRRGITLPDHVNEKLPLLQPRLNGFVPKVLFVLRYVVAAVVLIYVLNVIRIVDIGSWLDSELGLNMSGAAVSVFFILLIAYGIWLAMTSWVDYRLNPDYGTVPSARETTLLTLLRNAATIAILILTLMFCLSEIGLDIGPLLASAGVLGLAIGFGAQKMVQDIITGVFIQFENAINVGDVVTVGGTTGSVEKLTVRSVSLRDIHGVYHIIPFSSVDMVSNFTRDFSYFVCDMGVAYRENVEDVKQAMLDCFDELREDPEQASFITSDLEWFGLNNFGDSAVVLRARIKTLPGKQWGVGRAYNAILKRVFDERGIEIPFPHQTIFFGEAKDGSTQPIRLEGPEDATIDSTAEESDTDTATEQENGGRKWHDDDPDTGSEDDGGAER